VPDHRFDDLLTANRAYVDSFALGGLAPRAAKGVCIVTCMDTRIDPLGMLGLRPGDAKILRNAGGRVTDDVLRSLALAVALLGVTRVAVIEHTQCAMIGATNDALRAAVGEGAREWDFLPIADQAATLAADVERVRSSPLLPGDLEVAGFVYDVDTGRLRTPDSI
jgi:carbonic anhydrase